MRLTSRAAAAVAGGASAEDDVGEAVRAEEAALRACVRVAVAALDALTARSVPGVEEALSRLAQEDGL